MGKGGVGGGYIGRNGVAKEKGIGLVVQTRLMVQQITENLMRTLGIWSGGERIHKRFIIIPQTSQQID